MNIEHPLAHQNPKLICYIETCVLSAQQYSTYNQAKVIQLKNEEEQKKS